MTPSRRSLALPLTVALLAVGLVPTPADAQAPVAAPAAEVVPDVETALQRGTLTIDPSLPEIGGHGRFTTMPLDTRGRAVRLVVRLVSPAQQPTRLLLLRDGHAPRVVASRAEGGRQVLLFDEELPPDAWQVGVGGPLVVDMLGDGHRIEVELMLATRDALALPTDADLCTTLVYVAAHAPTRFRFLRGAALDERLGRHTGRLTFPGAGAAVIDDRLDDGAVGRTWYASEVLRGADVAQLERRHAELVEGVLACGAGGFEASERERTTDGWVVRRRVWTRPDGVRIEAWKGLPRAAGQEGAVGLDVFAPGSTEM